VKGTVRNNILAYSRFAPSRIVRNSSVQDSFSLVQERRSFVYLTLEGKREVRYNFKAGSMNAFRERITRTVRRQKPRQKQPREL
jgi:hypothetical protein